MRRTVIVLAGVVVLTFSAAAPGPVAAAPASAKKDCPAGYAPVPTPDKAIKVDHNGDGFVCQKIDDKAKGPTFRDN